MTSILLFASVLVIQYAESLNTKEKPTIVDIYPFYKNGSRAPESIFDVDRPGTIEIKIFLNDDLLLSLNMIRNKLYRGEGYKETMVSLKGPTEVKFKIKENCRFYGQLEDSSTSDAALTFCNGISGFVYSKDAEYRFKPIGKKIDEAYLEITPLSPKSKVEREKREYRYSYDRIVSVIELYVINDNHQFEALGRNPDDVFNWNLEVISIATRIFQRYDLHIILAGIEIWDRELQKFNYRKKTTLTDWLDYKKKVLLTRLPKHDTVIMFTSDHSKAHTKHLSTKYAMCDMHETGGILMKTETLEESAAMLLFLLGRLLGLRKESEFRTTCNCPAKYCVMHGNSSHNRALAFSSCSTAELRASLDKRTYPCLVTPARLDLKGVCGNGFLENDEECDCGNLIRALCNPTCCEVDACRLLMDAECNTGKCCEMKTCRLKPEKTVCRRNFGTCDMAEYCDGESPHCPPDEGVEDGRKCEEDNYCFNGRCGGRTRACQALWGPGATDGDSTCYVNNLSHDKFGHCYADYSKTEPYLTCNDLNIFCGILMCYAPEVDILDIKIRPSRIHRLGLTKNACKALEYRYWKYDFNPGYVPDGSTCDSEKICFRRRCIGLSIVPSISKYFFSLDIGTTLHGLNSWLFTFLSVHLMMVS